MRARRKGSPVGAAMVIFCVLAGALEVGLTVMSTGRFDPFGFPLLLGLWLCFGVAFAAVEWLILRLAFGPAAEWKLREDISSAWATHLHRDSPGLAALVPILAGLIGASVAWARFVVVEAHHPTWIALAIVAGQLGMVMAAYVGWRILKRFLTGFPLTPSGRTVIRSVLIAGFLGSVLILVARWDQLTLVGAPALLVPAVVILLVHGLALVRSFRLGLGPIGGLVVLLVAVASFSVGEQSAGARGMMSHSPWTGTYLRSGLGKLADLDRDGSPAFPFGDDCAPFDARIHPLAFDPAGNGVDENCDGNDEFQLTEGQRGPPEPLTDERPDLVLVTVDALRADHLSFMGYDRPTSPELDLEAERGIIFERAFSQDSGTGPSVWSMMTGKTPFQVELTNAQRFPPAVGEEEQLLAELLKEAGYETQAHLCGSMFRAPHWNIGRGFDQFEEVCGRRRQEQGPSVRDPGIAALRRQPDDPPLFLWVHFLDPHDPYFDHPGVSFGELTMDRYDEEIHYVQRFIAQFVREARSSGRHRPTFVFMTADHGENFREHGRDPHARTLYREVTNVPLVAWGPDVQARRVTGLVASSDLYPTFLDLAHVATPSASTMSSLVPFLRGDDVGEDRTVYQENSFSRPRRHVKALIRGRHHYIRDLTTRTNELYDLLADPGETHDLAGTGIAEEDELSELMDAFVSTTHLPEELR